MIFKIIKLKDQVCEDLGIENVPVEFGDIEDDSRLVFKPVPKIIINNKFINDYTESAKCLTHELRHVFQIFYSRIMQDELALLWKEELEKGINYKAEYNDYVFQAIEVDAFAFSQKYLREKLNIVFKYENVAFQNLIDQYTKKYNYVLQC